MLYRSVPNVLEATLALMLAAAIAYAVAIATPVMSLELQGRRTSETLFGLSLALGQADMTSIATLVFITVLLMPGVEIAACLYLVLPLRRGVVPAAFGAVSRLLFAVRPWCMVEVFVLGALVSIGRLHNFASLELGPAFWAIGAVMFLFAVVDTIFDPRTLWQCVASVRGAECW
jgi:paraquat-inducible protein A